MLYSVNMLRNFQRRKCCKEITENSQDIARPRREVLIFVVLAFVVSHLEIGAPLEVVKSTLSREVAVQ